MPCGPRNNFYSSAGTGMGLLSEAIMVELGYSTREEAEARLVQSLTSLISDWPREPFSGFMVHFTNRNHDQLREALKMEKLSEECQIRKEEYLRI